MADLDDFFAKKDKKKKGKKGPKFAKANTDILAQNLIENEKKEEKIQIINDYNKYLIFIEKYFTDENSQPLKKGKDLIKQIFN